MSSVIDLLFSMSWQLAAGAMLLIGFGAGIVYGKARARWQFEAELHAARDKAEWEHARREQVSRELEDARARAMPPSATEAKGSEAEAVVLRGEIDRLRTELRRTWEGQGEAHRRIQELEARLSLLLGRQLRRTGSGTEGDGTPIDHGAGPHGKGSASENVLSLWNAGGADPTPGSGS